MTIHSLLIIVPGAILLGITFSKALSGHLQQSWAKYVWSAIGIAALAYAFIN